MKLDAQQQEALAQEKAFNEKPFNIKFSPCWLLTAIRLNTQREKSSCGPCSARMSTAIRHTGT